MLTRNKVSSTLLSKSSTATKRQAIEILSGMKNPVKPSKETTTKEKKAKKKYTLK